MAWLSSSLLEPPGRRISSSGRTAEPTPWLPGGQSSGELEAIGKRMD
jgi:hypothetical protein